ncbi:hypothetical protein V1282_005691 [Nitrobacteraceae bacterium AZCC 2146]
MIAPTPGAVINKRAARDDLFGPQGKAPAGFAKQHTEGAQEPPDFVLQLDAGPNENLTSGQQRSNLVAISGLDPDVLEPACANDLGEPSGIIPVGLVRPHLQGSMGVPSIHADDWDASIVQFIL